MIAFTDLTGLAGGAIVMAVAATCLPGVASVQKSKRILLVAGVVAAALIPFGGLPLAGYLRGATGDLSIISLLLLVLALTRFMSASVPEDESSAPSARSSEGGEGRQMLLLLVVLSAAWLYPLALGIGLFDPYRLGYGSPWLVGGLLLLALAACFRGLLWVALPIALAVLAWAIGWHESGNLWDYLLDPLLAIYAAGALARRGVRALLK